MKIVLAIIALTIVAMAAAIYLLNRPQLNLINADLPDDFPDDGFSHDVFEELLKRYVGESGQVDYGAWVLSDDAVASLKSYLAAVSRFSPDNSPQRFSRRSDTLAYWLYAYNAYVINSILERWPLASVTDVKAPLEIVKGFGFFYRQRHLFGEVPYSLYDVENKKIRATYKDARIHFVLNCGSESCPILRPELPTGDKLDTLLQQAAQDFVSDSRNVWIDHDQRKVVLSEIFKWFEKDFINDLRKRGLPSDHGLLDYIASVSEPAQRAEIRKAIDYEVVFRDYDWSVNDSAVNTTESG